MEEQKNVSFIRWQGKTLEQLGFVNNLFIALASGFLILEAQSIFSKKFLQPCEALLIGLSVILVFASLIVGGFLAINRLQSFRSTSQIARQRETGQKVFISDLRKQVDNLDSKTWIMLWC